VWLVIGQSPDVLSIGDEYIAGRSPSVELG
jgi:hypothetical protein